MKCPYCSHLGDKVVDSRESKEGDAIRRRRECLECGKRFTSYERIDEIPYMVVKKDGSRERFERKKLVAGLRRKRQAVHFEQADLADIEALKRAIGAIRKALGPITILVNNAAHDERHTLEDVTPEYFDDRIRVNLRHQFFAIQAVVPDMKKAGNGSIINMGSGSWMVGFSGLPVYTAAKAGVAALLEAALDRRA